METPTPWKAKPNQNERQWEPLAELTQARAASARRGHHFYGHGHSDCDVDPARLD
jgi:hypothetical protein